MFPQKSPFCPLFGAFYPHFVIQSALIAAGASRSPAPRKEGGHVRSHDDGRVPTASCQIELGCTWPRCETPSLCQPFLGGRKKITGPLGRYPMLFPGSQNGCGLGSKLGE